MSINEAIQFVIKGWEEITAESIRNCWHHTKIFPNTNRMEIDFTEVTTISASSALKSLENVRLFLLQQEEIRLLNSLGRFVSGKKVAKYHKSIF